MILLAPMAGVTDAAFRHICYDFGCDVAFCEMISANALFYDSAKTLKLMTPSDNEPGLAVQIFGGDPALMGDMAKKIADTVGDRLRFLDINFGCPAPKVVKCGYGSALMADLKTSSAIIQKVARSVRVPVTVKCRSGIDEGHQNAVDFARMAESSGAHWITVHGRTAKQMYSGKADWGIIRQVKQAVSIPVVGNGDVFAPMDAVHMIQETGCDHVMAARGARGNPFLFAGIKAALLGQPPKEITEADRLCAARRHVRLCCHYKEEKQAVLEMRKHIAWYFTGVSGCAKVRQAVNQCHSKEQILEILDSIRLKG